jgi:hypothetical protein
VVQVEPMKPVLTAPGSMLLNLRYVGLLSKYAFNFNLRRYSEGKGESGVAERGGGGGAGEWLEVAVDDVAALEMFAAGAYTHSLYSST